jgi:hypothetical protein
MRTFTSPIPQGVFVATSAEVRAMCLADAELRLESLARWLIEHFAETPAGRQARRDFLMGFEAKHGAELCRLLEWHARRHWQERRAPQGELI